MNSIFRSSFGPINGQFNDATGPLILASYFAASDRRRVITFLSASYVDPGYTATPVFFAGRVLIVPGRSTDGAISISPLTPGLPATVQTPLFDQILKSPQTVLDLGPDGIVLLPNQEYTVILTMPVCTSGFPSTEDLIGSLNIVGHEESGSDPFPKLR
jgi:hypothetical protein